MSCFNKALAMMKMCKKCLVTLPYSSFYSYKLSKDKLRYECKSCYKLIKSQYQAKHPEKQRVYSKRYAKSDHGKQKISMWGARYHKGSKFKAYRREYENARYRNNPLYKLSSLIRRRTRLFVKQKGFVKDKTFIEYIGCSLSELKAHFESKFESGMTWKNHGVDGWHIDHIIPLSSAKTPEEIYKLCHYKNLQPMWAKENLRKGARHG